MNASGLILSATTLAAGIFSGTISLGVALVAFVMLGIVGYFAARFKIAELAQKQAEAANEAANTWRENYVAERTRADDFEKRFQEQRSLKHEALTRIATLELRTDQTAVLKALEAQMQALRTFHDDFLQRETEASDIRATVIATEQRMVSQLGEVAQALKELTTNRRRTA